MGTNKCAVTQKTMAFPIIVPRFKADGTRNTIDLTSGTLGADIQARLLASVAADDRFYPFLRVEESTWERSDTVLETAPSGRSEKIDGVGGVFSLNFKLWGKDAAFPVMREALKLGCSDLDFYYVDVSGNLWGIKDNLNDTILRGYEMDTATFDSFVEFATDTTVQKGMFSWNLDQTECVENAYVITSEELGYKATSLRPNISGYQTATAVTNTTCQSVVFTGFGSAGDRDDVTGLVIGDFTVENTDTPAGDIAISLVESPEGTYVITTSAMTAAENYKITCTKAGYDIADGTFVAV